MNRIKPLNINLLEQKLHPLHLVKNVVYLDEITSTNDLAKQISAEKSHHGTLIIAEKQTAGRGRKAKNWFSLPGKGLYFTLIIEPPLVPNLQILTLGAGVALARAIESICALITGLKWPNDVYIYNKKAAGILAESITRGTKSMVVILGVGINVNHDPQDFEKELSGIATSLKISTGKVISREDILAEFLRKFTYVYQEIIEGKASQVLKSWLNRALYIGKEVTVVKEKTSITGKVVGLNDAGAMLLRDHSNKIHEIWVADVVRCRNT